MFYAIIYTALAINATGLGDKKFYNADGALDPVAVTNTFEAAETGGLIGSDAAYTASLVTASSAQSLYAGNVQLINSFTRSSQVLTAYQHCSFISGGTIVDGEIVVPGGGGTPAQVLVATKTLTAAQIRTLHTGIEIIAAPGANKAIQVLGAAFKLNLVSPFTTTNMNGVNLTYGGDKFGTTLATAFGPGNFSKVTAGKYGSTKLPADFDYDDQGNVNILNSNLTIQDTNSSGNYSGGDGTLTVAVTYSILDLS